MGIIFSLPINIAYSTLDFLHSFYVPTSKNLYLQNNFKPVKEIGLVNDLKVQGELPSDLRGEFVRNGPNPQNIPKGGYHWFDGDGMLHGVRIADNDNGDGATVNYVNRLIQTHRLKAEKSAGRVLYPRLGEMYGKTGLLKLLLHRVRTTLGLVDNTKGKKGTSNTSVVFHHNELLALVESDLPVSIKMLLDGELQTIGENSFNGKLKHPFTAHPKLDPRTKEMLFFGYQIEEQPFCSYSIVNKEGELVQTTDLKLKGPTMMHDFAITENYSIFLDMPLEFNPRNIVSGGVFTFNDKRPSRIGVIPRYGKSSNDVKWFEFKPGYIFHTFNAWEDGDNVVLYACRSSTLNFDQLFLDRKGNESPKQEKPMPYEYIMNMKTGECSERNASDIVGEFPIINPNNMGIKTKYGYMASLAYNQKVPLFNGCVKFNMENNFTVEKQFLFGDGKFGGECVFVPKKEAVDEDDGYLLTFVFDTKDQTSSFVVYDAKTMNEVPLATVPLPQRVPYGFHGIWVEEEDIKQQKLYGA